jgi:glutamate---cysteine ligase / carboxylate-amine ligase
MSQHNDALTGGPPRFAGIPVQGRRRAQDPADGVAVRDGWWGPTVRTVGVEEELLIVDAGTGRPVALSEQVRRLAPEHLRAAEVVGPRRLQGTPGGHVTSEMQQLQVEIDTAPRTELGDLARDLRAWRAATGDAARELGARVVATGVSPLPFTGSPTSEPRYEAIVERFGLTAHEQLTCGCHIHVGVASDEEAVGVLDRIRRWLPVLLAISANSPYLQGQDTGYASFRSQVWARWPTVGPTDVFGSARRYHSSVADLISTGVLLDRGMIYFDARLSASFPTVEIRVADVCARVEDAVLLAALCRALVDTAAEAWALGWAAPPVPTELLRLATWRAGHDGVEGSLLDPMTARPRAAPGVLEDLLVHVTPALARAGDLAHVEHQLETVLRRGTGARAQREAGVRGDLAAVVAELSRTTLE